MQSPDQRFLRAFPCGDIPSRQSSPFPTDRFSGLPCRSSAELSLVLSILIFCFIFVLFYMYLGPSIRFHNLVMLSTRSSTFTALLKRGSGSDIFPVCGNPGQNSFNSLMSKTSGLNNPDSSSWPAPNTVFLILGRQSNPKD